MKKNNHQLYNLQTIIAEINKKYGNNTIGFIKDMKPMKVERLSSGSIMLDYCLNGGFPRGRVVELYGPYSSGKGLISFFTIAEAQRNGLQCVWIDAENVWDPEFANRCGVNIDKLILSQSSVGETTIDLVGELLKAKPDIIAIDSVAAMIPKKDLEEPLDQAVMATRARLMSRGLAKLNTLNKDTLIIFINQIRSTLTPYGPKYFTPGGYALGHYASIRVEVNRGELLRDKEKTFGQVVKFRVTKNKSGAPFRTGYFKFLYDDCGIDKIDEIITLGLLLGKIKIRAAYFDLLGKSFHGRQELERALIDNEFFNLAKKEILENG